MSDRLPRHPLRFLFTLSLPFNVKTPLTIRIIMCLVALLATMPVLHAEKKKGKEATVLVSKKKNRIGIVADIGPSMNMAVLAPLDANIKRNIRPDLLALRDDLLDEAKARPVASPATYTAATRLIDSWLSALGERETRRASLGLAAPPTTDMDHSKKQNLHFWDDILMFQREIKDAAEKKAKDKKMAAFFKDADKNNWRLRADILRPDLEKRYAQFRELRRQSE